MSQKFFNADDHAEMVTNWIAESIECTECRGDGCGNCGDLGRIALCDTGHDDLEQEVADRERAELDADADLGRDEASERQGDLIAQFRAEY